MCEIYCIDVIFSCSVVVIIMSELCEIW
uniref:Uncharacterized protein n=1 Tax=Anguilla anguilla TaxID=7936 RepID=A0A0E9U3X5_ANGAN